MNFKSNLMQISASIVFSTMAAMSAFSAVWPSYSLRVLESAHSPLGFSITKSQGNLIGSIPMLGSLSMSLFAGFVSDKLGRKKTHVLCSLFIIVSWSLILTSRSRVQILSARFILGLSMSMSIINTLVYIGEVTQVSVRGPAMAAVTLMYNVGILISYIEGWFCSYDVICYVNITGMVVYVLLVCCFKESPVWLLKCGKEEDALNSLKWYRFAAETTDPVLEELAMMKGQFQQYTMITDTDLEKSKADENEKEKLNKEENNLNKTKSENPWILLISVDHNRRAFVTTVTVMVVSVLMGMIAVQTYAGQFFEAAVPSISADLCSVLLAVVLVLGSVLTVAVTNLLGRRTLLISTSIVSVLCLAALGAALRWRAGPAWLPAAIVLVYCVFFHLGPINIPFIMLGEVFGPDVNSVASSLTLAFMFICNFVVLYAFGPAVEALGVDGTFFVFAAIGAIGVVISYLIMKESRNKPLSEVQEMYAAGYLYRKM